MHWFDLWEMHFGEVKNPAGWQAEIAHARSGIDPVPDDEEMCNAVRALSRKWNQVRYPKLHDLLRELRQRAGDRKRKAQEREKDVAALAAMIRRPPVRPGAVEETKRYVRALYGEAVVKKAEREASNG